jgi:hypothetical protein
MVWCEDAEVIFFGNPSKHLPDFTASQRLNFTTPSASKYIGQNGRMVDAKCTGKDLEGSGPTIPAFGWVHNMLRIAGMSTGI